MLDQSLLKVHTAFFAKVLLINKDGKSAKIQPLNLIQAQGGNPQKQEVLSDVPVLSSVRKFDKDDKPKKIEKGDIVYCLCAERDITEVKKGNFDLPPIGHHELSDAVIIGAV